jgi:chemotaxis protein CheX
VPFDAGWKAILERAAIEVFELMAGVRPELTSHANFEPRDEQTAMVGVAGASCGMTTVRCSQSTSAKLASRMQGGDAASSASTSRDALGELCNTIAGNFIAKINTLADHCMLSVPTVIFGESYSLETADPTESLRVLPTGRPGLGVARDSHLDLTVTRRLATNNAFVLRAALRYQQHPDAHSASGSLRLLGKHCCRFWYRALRRGDLIADASHRAD